MSEKKRNAPEQLQSAAPEEFGQAMTLVRLLVLEELRARPVENRPGAAQKCGLQPCELQPCAVQSGIQGKALSAGVRLAAPPVFRPVEPAAPALSAVCLPALPAAPVPVQVKYSGKAAHVLPPPAPPAMRLQIASPPLPQAVPPPAAAPLPPAAALRLTAPPCIGAPHLAAPIRPQAVHCVKKPPLFAVNIRR